MNPQTAFLVGSYTLGALVFLTFLVSRYEPAKAAFIGSMPEPLKEKLFPVFLVFILMFLLCWPLGILVVLLVKGAIQEMKEHQPVDPHFVPVELPPPPPLNLPGDDNEPRWHCRSHILLLQADGSGAMTLSCTSEANHQGQHYNSFVSRYWAEGDSFIVHAPHHEPDSKTAPTEHEG